MWGLLLPWTFCTASSSHFFFWFLRTQAGVPFWLVTIDLRQRCQCETRKVGFTSATVVCERKRHIVTFSPWRTRRLCGSTLWGNLNLPLSIHWDTFSLTDWTDWENILHHHWGFCLFLLIFVELFWNLRQDALTGKAIRNLTSCEFSFFYMPAEIQVRHFWESVADQIRVTHESD